VRRRIGVTERDTGKVHHGPPPWFEPQGGDPLPRILPDVSDLTPAEWEVYEAVERRNIGPREYARRTDRAFGTVGNLLRRAREKVGGESQ
jgi:DNA-directed RNA polymerase specialized sigma24 family protein